MEYRRADDQLFGKYCYIDTPWIAGKKTIYRIIRSGVRSNAWCEVPVNGLTKKVNHGEHSEEIVFVVLDTLIDEDTEIMRFALKDIELIDEPNNCETCRHNKLEWYSEICDSCCGNNNHYEPKDEPKLCRECDDYAGDGMFCAKNYLVYNFDTCKDEPQTEVSAQEYERWLFKEPQTEDEILREQCHAFMGIVEQTERGE